MEIKIFKDGAFYNNFQIPEEDIFVGAEFFIGRNEDCHIQISDFRISRHHAKLSITSSEVKLVKLSDNGSLKVNGAEVREKILTSQDKIELLDYIILVSNYLPNSKSSSEDIVIEEDKTEILTEDDSLSDAEGLTNLEEPNEQIDEVEHTEDFQDQDSFLASDEVSESEDSVSDETFEENGFKEEPFPKDSYTDESSFEENGFEENDSDEKTQVFQNFATYSLRIFGEYAPFDRYVIDKQEVFIGRDPEKCQIVLNDPEVSSLHAVIKKNLLNCILVDKDSSNGTIVNGERINQTELIDGVEFLIGSTSFTVEVDNDLYKAEKETLMPVEKDQEIEVEEIVEEEVDFQESGSSDFSIEDLPKEKSLLKRIWKNKRQRLYLIAGVLVVLLLMMGDDDKPKVKENNNKNNQPTNETIQNTPAPIATKKELPPEILEKLEQNYVLALAKYEAGEYYEAKGYLDTIVAIDENYKDTQTLLGLVKQGYEEITRLKQEEQKEKERRARQLEVEKLLIKAREATKNKEVLVAESLFAQILEKDPENLDVPQLRLEIEAYNQQELEKKLENERKIAERKRMVDALAPGKTLYLREDWFQAILKLEIFLNSKGMDEDLIKEATEMLNSSKIKLANSINPLLGKARSFQDGQDLKKAYQTYGEILKIDPSHEQALREREIIKETLDSRSKKLYRDALISESLSLFSEAKEKLEEVMQISPNDSEYYEKAQNKLQEYLE